MVRTLLAHPFRMGFVQQFFGQKNRELRRFSLTALVVSTGLSSLVGCARETSVYSDPSSPAAVTPVSTGGNGLPTNFYNQSVNRASVEIQPDGVSADSKALRFQTSSGTNDTGGFNGTGVGNRAVLGLGSWHARPVSQAEPISFDAQSFAGSEAIGVSLQIDLKCDGTEIRVVGASGAAIATETTSSGGDGYTRFTASLAKPIWNASGNPILSSDASYVIVPSSGSRVSLTALLSEYPAACLRNASTSASDLPKGIPTAAVLWALGQDSTSAVNSVFVRRLSVGSEVFEGLE